MNLGVGANFCDFHLNSNLRRYNKLMSEEEKKFEPPKEAKEDADGFWIMPDGSFYDPDGYHFDKDGKD